MTKASFRRLALAGLKAALEPLVGLLPDAIELRNVRVEVRRRAALPKDCEDRFGYQRRFVAFEVTPGQKVLDIGSGGYPFPHATVLCDRFLDAGPHRHEALVKNGVPFTVAAVECLPFRHRAFDFVYCSHVLEHVQDPILACAEIARVARRGYIETPTFAKDVLLAWAAGMHRWHVVAAGSVLCFFEYSDRQLDGIRSPAWRDTVLGPWAHPLRDAFWNNQDLFNVMFSWSDGFTVYVFARDGSVRVQAVGSELFST